MKISMGRMTPVALGFAVLWVLLAAGVVQADIYTFRDSHGVIHFTNVPAHPGYRPIIGGVHKDSPSLMSPGHFGEIIRSVSERYGVDPRLVQAVIKVESDFDRKALSHKGAQGLMQLMPETARRYQVKDVYDPKQNIKGGVQHLSSLLGRFQGDIRLTLAAYNAGTKSVDQYGGIPPFAETKEYVRRVLQTYRRYRGNGPISVRTNAQRYN